MIGNIDILVKELSKLPKEVGWVGLNSNTITVSQQWLGLILVPLPIVLH